LLPLSSRTALWLWSYGPPRTKDRTALVVPELGAFTSTFSDTFGCPEGWFLLRFFTPLVLAFGQKHNCCCGRGRFFPWVFSGVVCAAVVNYFDLIEIRSRFFRRPSSYTVASFRPSSYRCRRPVSNGFSFSPSSFLFPLAFSLPLPPLCPLFLLL